ncbi:hypothetical protein L226DRAFT_529084 [Lentinus tigrinus ALCF2SS1-7]|uniref:Uncharacterized protein n=1 Tax=Lentinus tigrinus ALCF2SS1-6 TaxID=1328759 RepID=A0A5C2T2U3_9APHY|nr:hypothetical protein L227DRAFT_647869 [Lentinus tigrinus ALCF2SS1-6]RPD80617.1 hypothetical protein L226DRAFT_529084 [Lentinus tigrinus ALCF2SS1-7]
MPSEHPHMHEFVRPRRRIFTTEYDDDEEEEYDVYYFFPSQNRVYSRLRLSPEAAEDERAFTFTSDSEVSSIDSLPALEHLRKLPSSPPDARIPELVFTGQVEDCDIKRFGYNQTFRTGLWAQSRRFTRRLDAFIAKAMARLRSLKRCLTRRTS